ncbi:MAG: MMPL family transporter [Gammaproteobacteria bacterium]
MLESAENSYRKIIIRLVETCARNAAGLLIAVILVTAALFYYALSHLSLDTNTTNMLDARLPFRQLERELERAFPQFTDLVVVVVDANSAQRAENAASSLAEKLKQTQGLTRSIYQPGQDIFFARNGLLYLERKDLWELSDKLAEAAPLMGALAGDASLRGLFSVLGRALEENPGTENSVMLKKIFDEISASAEAQLAGHRQALSWQNQFSGNLQALGNNPRSFILVQPRLDYTSLQPGAAALDTIRRLAAETEAQQDVRIRLTGPVAIDDEELQSVAQGAEIATILSFGLVCLILITGLRSLRLTLVILITLLIGLTWTAAFAAFAIGYLNLISVTFAVLFIGLGVDFGIQFAMRYREEFDRQDSHAAALSHAAEGVGGALTLAAIAAAISFFSFVPTSYRGLAELGIISAAGMFIALLANLTVLPALLTLMPVRARLTGSKDNILTRLHFPVRRYSSMIILVTLAVSAGAALLLPQARFDFNPLNMKDPATESVATFLDLLDNPQTTPYTLDVLTGNLAEAQKLAVRLERLKLVDKTITLVSFVPDNQDEKLAAIDDMSLFLQPLMPGGNSIAKPTTQENIIALDAFREKLLVTSRTQSNRELAASSMRLAEALTRLKSAPGWPGRTLEDFTQSVIGDLPQSLAKLSLSLMPKKVTLNDLPADLKQRYVTADGRARIEIYPKEDVSRNEAMYRFVKAVKAVAPNAIGTPVALVEASDAVIKACLQATATAPLAAILLLLVMLRSIAAALLVLLPLALATLLTVASSALLDIPFNLANVIALPLLLGLGIAFGIYLVMRKRSGISVDELFDSSTPRAVLFSALTTVASFGALAFSNHRGMASMGLLLTLALSFALLCTLIVLPAIMAKMQAGK